MANVEEQIQKAIREGKFSNLPGRGKPLRLEDDAYTDPDWRMAFHLLRENGFSLPWMELRMELENELGSSRQELTDAWKWRLGRLEEQAPAVLVEGEWQRARAAFRLRIEKLNRRIMDYNLQAPSTRFQMLKLRPEQEIERIQQNGA